MREPVKRAIIKSGTRDDGTINMRCIKGGKLHKNKFCLLL